MKKPAYLFALFIAASLISCKKDNNSTTTSVTESYTNGDIYTIAGNGATGYSGDGGAATSAELSFPSGVAVDKLGNIYIADNSNNVIREVNAGGIISTIAGTGTAGFSGDGGAASSAQLNLPVGVAVDSSGNVYIADYNNQRIRKITTSGIISTYAGNGIIGFSGDGAAASSAELDMPYGVAVDITGNVYVADENNNRIRIINTSGTISTFAGNGTQGYSGDGAAATAAELNNPGGVAVDRSGNVYIADDNNERIRKVNTSGIILTFAGNGIAGFYGDGGPAVSAELYRPGGVTVDTSGNVYIADVINNRIRIVTPAGNISTYAGNGTQGYIGDNGAAVLAELNLPTGVASSISGNIYIADNNNQVIREIYK